MTHPPAVVAHGDVERLRDGIGRSLDDHPVVAGFLPGTEAGALADLFAGSGGLDFTARLSFAWPNTPCPSGGEPASESLFARGFGLSYDRARQTGRLNEVAGLKFCQ